MINKTLLFLLLYLVCCFDLYGQNDTYNFRHLSTSDGLSQSSVIAIEQDMLGQIWIGTRDGLNKYNGNSFKIFRNNPSDSISLSNNDILDIEEDTSGNIWIGTYNGLSVYDPVKNKFKNYFHKKDINSLSNNTVLCLKEISNGDIWIGTSNGLSIYKKKSNRFVNIYHDPDKSYSISGDYIISIYEDSNGSIWVGTSNGLSKSDNISVDNLKFKKIDANHITRESNQEIWVQDILEDENSNLLIATKNFGLLKMSPLSNKLSPYFSEKDQELVDRDVRELYVDKDKALWIGTYNGLNVLKKNGTLSKYLNEPNNPNSLSKNPVKSLFRDRKGSMWIGTYYGGINIWDDSNVNFINFSQNTGPTTLSYDVVSSIQYDNIRDIYIGTEGGGITILNTLKNEVEYIRKSINNNLPSDNIKSLFLDNNNLWIGTFDAGVSVYNIEKKKFEIQNISNELLKFLQNTGVYAIKKDNNNLWLGVFGKGLVSYDLFAKKFKVYKVTNGKSNSLTSNLVRTFLIDSKKNIWVGTQHGLNLITKTGAIKHYFFNDEIKSGEDVLSIYEDSQNNIWIGTNANGLFKFNGLDFDAIKLSYKRESINSIHSITEDKNGNLWLSSNQGLIKFNPKNQNVLIYNQKEGLISNEFNNNSFLNIGGNHLYFGGPLGITSFNVENISINGYAPQVILTDFKVKNNSIDVINDNDILKTSIEYAKSITLPYDKANFSIEFAIPNFINPKNNLYQYRLVGLQDQWITTSQTIANFTIQNAGNYIFEVKGANNDGIWTTSATSLKIKVKPAPWRSWWAFSIYTLLIAISLYILSNILKSKTKLKHQLEFEHTESERIKELNNNKLEFFTNISHEFRTPLTLILGPLQQILEDFKGSNKIYKKLLIIEGSANHLLQLINRLMDFRKLENNFYKLEAAEGNIIEFLQEIYLSFTEYAKEGNYDYNFIKEEDSVMVFYDRYKLERVFYNLISNAFRYTPKKGTINLVVKLKDGQIFISVEDTGIGIPKEYHDKIFERFFEIKTTDNLNKNYNKGTGIGLSIAYNIVKLHKGKISVTNNINNEGTIFMVSLPLGNFHLEENEILKDFKVSDDVEQYLIQIDDFNIACDDDDILNQVNLEVKETILLVEDDQPLRSFMKSLLKKEYEVLEAENGKLGLDKALKYMPDLIVSDVIMPEMVGTELCSKIKGNIKTSHIPVILLTSRSSLIYKFEGLESGANDYISKPFNIKEFKLRIKNILESNRILKEKFSKEDYILPSDIAVSDLDQKLLKKAIDVVHENLSNEMFDIPLFTSELGVSRTVLFTKIKAWTNFTPNEFITEIRMKKAAELLERKSMNISEISYKVGFKNPKYFSKCFHKKYGLTPSQYSDKFYKEF